MNTWRGWAILLLLCVVSSLSFAQKKICIGSVGGSDAATFNIQQPLFKALTSEAASRGDNVTAQLMTNSNEKTAKGEMSALKCDFALMSNINREWPQPKGGMNAGTGGGGGKDDNPHPPSTSRFHFILLDKNGKKMDKFETSVEMQIRYTAKDVETEVTQILQEVANWTLDSTIANK